MESRTLAARIGLVHLYYVSLVPAAGTFCLIAFFGVQLNLLTFAIGGAAVGICLATGILYAPIGDSPWRNLLQLLDGPFWVTLSSLLARAPIRTAFVVDMLVEMTAILLGLLVLTIHSRKVPDGKRPAAIFAAGVPLAGVVLVGWIFLAQQSWTTAEALAPVAGALQGAAVQGRVLAEDRVLRQGRVPLITGLVAWVLSTLAGPAFLAMH
jgi:hypothetical protein